MTTADDPQASDWLILSEERVSTDVETVEVERVTVRKRMVTDEVTMTIPLRHEEVEIIREPLDLEAQAVPGPLAGTGVPELSTSITLYAERPVVSFETVPVERVRLSKQTVTEDVPVVTEVGHEELDVTELPPASGRSA
jgi:uncharacterized protein (TIGR02271 family)